MSKFSVDSGTLINACSAYCALCRALTLESVVEIHAVSLATVMFKVSSSVTEAPSTAAVSDSIGKLHMMQCIWARERYCW